ncbi:MAG: ATP-binding protein, partial [Solirubrobacterales bacterium]
FTVHVRDDGTWLERTPGEGDAGGLGIPLMEAVTRELEISSGDQGTTVRLEFALEREDALSDELNESAERADA